MRRSPFSGVLASGAGEPLKLSHKEFGTLRFLIARAGEVVLRSELLEEVWDYQEYPTTRTVDNDVASLRVKIERDTAQPRHLLILLNTAANERTVVVRWKGQFAQYVLPAGAAATLHWS